MQRRPYTCRAAGGSVTCNVAHAAVHHPLFARFYARILSPNEPAEVGEQRIQGAVDRIFRPRAFGGCHTARDTVAAIEAAGFTLERHERLRLADVPTFIPVATHALGTARRPA